MLSFDHICLEQNITFLMFSHVYNIMDIYDNIMASMASIHVNSHEQNLLISESEQNFIINCKHMD